MIRNSTTLNEADESELEAAAKWQLRIEADPSVRQSQPFLEWFSSEKNKAAFERVCGTLSLLNSHRVMPEMLAIRAESLERARAARSPRRPSARLAAYGVAAGLLLACLGGVTYWRMSLRSIEYSTEIGEHKVVDLEDGSRVFLDSDTDVRVKYTRSLRQLKLSKGRARFTVTHNLERPFTVTAGNETVVAVGTTFDVERLGNKVLVTLIQGRIIVKQASSSPADAEVPMAKPLVMTVGQQLTVGQDSVPKIETASAPSISAWESGRIILNDEPLADAVARIDRYTDKPVAVDPSVADIRVSGSFEAGDIQSFVDAVTSYFPVRVAVSTNNQLILLKEVVKK
jgi:transmembrane sensor